MPWARDLSIGNVYRRPSAVPGHGKAPAATGAVPARRWGAGYWPRALSRSSSSMRMQDSMIGSIEPFITWSRLYALYPVR